MSEKSKSPFVFPTLSPTYAWPVPVAFIQGDGGPLTMTFTAIFKRFSQSELAAQRKRWDANGTSDREAIADILAGWGTDMQTSNGEPMPFTPEHLALVLDLQPMEAAIIKAWKLSLVEGARGNG
jgi:hypothetical protein